MDDSDFRRAGYLLRVVSDPERLRMAWLLLGGRQCVAAICAALETSRHRVLRDLECFRAAGLVCVRRMGRTSFYSLAPAKTPFHRCLLRCIRNGLGESPEPIAAVGAESAVLRPRRGRPRHE
jgi:DNA-binding transcriptional ArsR family regulator